MLRKTYKNPININISTNIIEKHILHTKADTHHLTAVNQNITCSENTKSLWDIDINCVGDITRQT